MHVTILRIRYTVYQFWFKQIKFLSLLSTPNVRIQKINACCGGTFDSVNVRMIKSEKGSAFSIDTTISPKDNDSSSGQY